jgi:hypothetical protein
MFISNEEKKKLWDELHQQAEKIRHLLEEIKAMKGVKPAKAKQDSEQSSLDKKSSGQNSPTKIRPTLLS